MNAAAFELCCIDKAMQLHAGNDDDDEDDGDDDDGTKDFVGPSLCSFAALYCKAKVLPKTAELGKMSVWRRARYRDYKEWRDREGEV